MNIHAERVARAAGARDERGVALPLALLGLVAVSLLVTTALVTSSTELALSNAHQDGTRGIYQAETALEEYVASRFAVGGANALQGSDASADFTTSGGDHYSIAVARLYSSGIADVGNDLLRREETYSLVSSPASGRGRAVAGMITVRREMTSLNVNINSAALVGSEKLALPGGSYTLSGIDGCTGDTLAGLTLAKGVQLTRDIKDGQVIGGVDSTDIEIADFAKHILGGRTPEEVANLANIKWGDIAGGTPHSGSLDVSNLNAIASGLNWGCPTGLVDCGDDPDADFYPFVAVEPNGTAEVDIGGVGQGFLIILGEAELEQHFKFNGIIIVVGDVHINAGVEIEGALIALSDVTLTEESQDGTADELTLNGQTSIKYDSCKVAAATEGAHDRLMDRQAQQFTDPTRSWFEIVR